MGTAQYFSGRGSVAARCLIATLSPLAMLGCGDDSTNLSSILGTYMLTPTSPVGASYNVTAEYVFHSAEANPGAGPNCVDVVYDQHPVVATSGLGLDFYRNVTGFTTCPNIFNAIVNGTHGSTALQFGLVGNWTSIGAVTPALHVNGTYTAMIPPSGTTVESGTFVFDLAVNPGNP